MSDANAGFSLEHPCGVHIQRDLREQDIRVVQGVRTRDHRNGYVWYYLPHAEIAGQEIWMGLCFFEQALDSVHLGIVDEMNAAGMGNWDPLKEQARAESTTRWLADVGYPVGKYPWGEVDAGIDPKTGDASGIVRLVRDGKATPAVTPTGTPS